MSKQDIQKDPNKKYKSLLNELSSQGKIGYCSFIEKEPLAFHKQILFSIQVGDEISLERIGEREEEVREEAYRALFEWFLDKQNQSFQKKTFMRK